MSWLPVLVLAAALASLLLVERWIHRRMQGVALLLTGDPEIAVVVYALPLLPGIILHELSHALAARLLGAQVGRISIRPERQGDRIRLGFVPVEKTGVVRDSLIGLAPLLVGSGVTLLIGYLIFGIDAVGGAILAGDWHDLFTGLWAMLGAPDLWIWAYVIFAVSNTMLPSRTDRRAWTPVLLFLLLVALLTLLAGMGGAIVQGLSGPLTIALRWLTAMCVLTLLMDLPFVLFIAAMERVLERIQGVKVVY